MKLRAVHVMALLIALFTIYFTFLSFAKHDNYYSLRLDLGNMDQTVWNVVNGNGFTLTDPMGTSQESRLAIHADFLLILLSPLYFLWSNPKMLIFVQVFGIALGSVPVFLLAKKVLASEKIALLFSLSYLLYPAIQRLVVDDFHAVALATPLLLFAFWFMINKKYVLFIFFSILAGLSKEQVWLVVMLMGMYVAVRQKKYMFGGIIMLMSFIFFYILMWKVIPAHAPAKQHFALAYLSEFGSGQNEILKNMMKNPVSVLKNMIMPDRLFYYIQLFFPVGFFSLLAPGYLFFALPDLLINTISSNMFMRWIDFQYTSTITPFIFVSAIFGFPRVKKVFTNSKFLHYMDSNNLTVGVYLFSFILCAYGWGDLPIGPNSNFSNYLSARPEKATITKVKKNIEKNKSVSVTNNIGAHFSQRQYVYNFPVNADQADYILVQMDDKNAWPSLEEQQWTVWSLLVNPKYQVIAHDGQFYAFQKI